MTPPRAFVATLNLFVFILKILYSNISGQTPSSSFEIWPINRCLSLLQRPRPPRALFSDILIKIKLKKKTLITQF